ncbi:MAG TPA: hypothetical protein VN822_06420 [Candidatus Acidoferrales bacterium]|nr:hypothetical protein [Candidatus Acidoferrales bacterium]
MAADPDVEPKPDAGIRAYVIVSALALTLVLAYVGWVFFSRWQGNRAIEERAAGEKRAEAQQTFEGMGGDRFEILRFDALPGVIRSGDELDLCYGVSNAKSVTLEPQKNAVWPAYSRCVKVSPRKTTTYTLTATDAAGHTKTSTVTVEVH